MLFPETFDQAKALGQEALSLMEQYGVCPNPKFYTLWYVYASGRNANLCRSVDIILDHSDGPTPEQMDELYEKFIGAEVQQDEVLRAGNDMAAVLAKVLDFVEEANQTTSDYREQLRNFTGDIAHVASGDELRGLVNRILVETRRMEKQNRELESKLNESSAQINDLSTRLEDVKRESLTDALTGIANRKCFDNRLLDSISRAEETDQPLSLLMVDIDHFKRFNDTYGHQMGDQVLKLIGAILKQAVRGRDTPARYGGEEFAVILPKTALQEAITLADQIRRTVAKRRVTRKSTGEKLCQITLSLGVAQYRHGEQAVELLLRADEALYAAKRGGRNRVISEEIFKDLPAAG